MVGVTELKTESLIVGNREVQKTSRACTTKLEAGRFPTINEV